jgi:RimJ/RimL family protein N-acetyltransferase
LADLLAEAAAGRPPPSDGLVEVLPSLGPEVDDAIVGFDGHLVVTADVPAEEVRSRLPEGAFGLWCHPAVALWLAERTGRDPGPTDIVFSARAKGGPPPIDLVEVDTGPAGRLRRSQARSWTTADGSGSLSVGRGLAGRWELAYAVDPGAQGAGRGRTIAAAARHLVPHGEVLWAQTAPGNVRSVRALLAAGFVPVAGETLLLADRPPPPIPATGGLELRPLRHADAEAHRVIDDEATRRGFGFPRIATAVEVHLAVAGWRAEDPTDALSLGVWHGDEVVGQVTVRRRPDGAVDLSYATAPAWRRRGVAVAAARAALAHVAEAWGVRWAVIEILPDNPASLAVARRLATTTPIELVIRSRD